MSDSLISRIIDKIVPQIREWQSRRLEPLYPIVYMDTMVFDVRDDSGYYVKKSGSASYLGVLRILCKWNFCLNIYYKISSQISSNSIRKNYCQLRYYLWPVRYGLIPFHRYVLVHQIYKLY